MGLFGGAGRLQRLGRSFLGRFSPENIHDQVSDIFADGQTLRGGYKPQVIVLVTFKDH